MISRINQRVLLPDLLPEIELNRPHFRLEICGQTRSGQAEVRHIQAQKTLISLVLRSISSARHLKSMLNSPSSLTCGTRGALFTTIRWKPEIGKLVWLPCCSQQEFQFPPDCREQGWRLIPHHDFWFVGRAVRPLIRARKPDLWVRDR